MSTHETVAFHIARCPCGGGWIRNHATTQDHPWSGSDSYIILECPTGAPLWNVQHHRLTLKSAERAAVAASAARSVAHTALRAHVDVLLDGRFRALAAPTKKAELQAMDVAEAELKAAYQEIVSHPS